MIIFKIAIKKIGIKYIKRLKKIKANSISIIYIILSINFF